MPEKAKFDRRPFGYAVGSRLSLAAKLYSIFALFAVLTAAITILSDYNTRRNAELTEAIETASHSAFNVERVNSLVYAERSKEIARQTGANRSMAFVLTGLGGLALVLVCIGVLIISRSVARPLSAITATIKRVAEGAESVEVPHTNRADEIGALACAIQVFQEAMDRN